MINILSSHAVCLKRCSEVICWAPGAQAYNGLLEAKKTTSESQKPSLSTSFSYRSPRGTRKWPVIRISGAPNVNFQKISVRETIWDIEFSDQLLSNFLLACFSLACEAQTYFWSTLLLSFSLLLLSLRSPDVFLVVASLPPKMVFGGREATIGNTSALRRLASPKIFKHLKNGIIAHF